jgi:cell division transport system permease protein
MSPRVRKLGYSVARALASLRRRPMIAALSVGVVAVSLLLVGLAYLAERNVSRLSERWGAGVQMIVYLEEGTPENVSLEIASALGELETVQEVRFIPPDEAYEHLRHSLGEHDELLDGVEVSYLPASIEVELEEGVRDLASAHPVIERLEKTPYVEEVEFLGNWVDNLTATIARIRKAGTWILLTAALFGVFTIVATMRLTAPTRARELRVLELMGASSLMRAGPGLIEGAAIGVAGAGLALALLWFFFQSAAPAVAETFVGALGDVELVFLNGRDFAQILIVGVSLGLAGALVSSLSWRRARLEA